MSRDTVEHILASAVADAGTFTVGYPDGRNSGSYELGAGHKIVSNKYGKFTDNVAFTFGTASVTVTNNTGMTLEAGTVLYVEFDRPGGSIDSPTNSPRAAHQAVISIDLGAPDVADVDGLIEAVSQSAGAMTLDGALVVDGVAIMDVPRNLVADSGGADTAVLTITGTDEYGNTMVETITLNGTTAVPGKKAFKTVTSVVAGATISNGAFLGTGDVLGLPVYLSDLGRVLKELQDGIAATAGTTVAGVTTAATATTGDVRGTYDPNAACDGAKAFNLIAVVDNPSDHGVAQYAG